MVLFTGLVAAVLLRSAAVIVATAADRIVVADYGFFMVQTGAADLQRESRIQLDLVLDYPPLQFYEFFRFVSDILIRVFSLEQGSILSSRDGTPTLRRYDDLLPWRTKWMTLAPNPAALFSSTSKQVGGRAAKTIELVLPNEDRMSAKSGKADDSHQDSQREENSVATDEPQIQPDLSKAEELAVHRWERRATIVNICTNVLLVLIGIVGTVLILRQLGQMIESNRITRESNIETKRANEAALAEMRASNLLTQESTEESKRQSEAALAESMRQAEASRIQSAADAAASLILARESLEESRLTQRARLVADIENIEIVTNSQGLTSARVLVRNTGVLPATKVRHQVLVEVGDGSGSAGLTELHGSPTYRYWNDLEQRYRRKFQSRN